MGCGASAVAADGSRGAKDAKELEDGYLTQQDAKLLAPEISVMGVLTKME